MLFAYGDSTGVMTIGYGHTGGVHHGEVITQQVAEEWFYRDMQHACNSIVVNVRVDVSQGEYDALADFIFNVGAEAFERSTLLRKLNEGDYNGAANQFGAWHYAGKISIPALVRRRRLNELRFRNTDA